MTVPRVFTPASSGVDPNTLCLELDPNPEF